MIYTVTLNPSLDYNVSVDNFNIGQINIIDSSYLLPGGKGINVAKVLNNLQQPVEALGFLAGFTGKEILRLLENENLKFNFVELENGITRINVKLKSYKETEINGQGPEVTKNDIAKLMANIHRIENGDFLVLSGSVPSSCSDNLYETIIQNTADKDIKIIIDARKELLKDCLKYHPFLVKPNIIELGEMFDVKITNDEDLWKYSTKVKELGALNVLVSLSKDGALLLGENGKHYLATAPQGKLINSVGAGDSMVAGFISGYIESNGDLAYTLKKAVATGSASAFSKGLATKEKIEQLIKKVTVSEK